MTIKLMQGTEVRHASGITGRVVVPMPDTNGDIVVLTEDEEYDAWNEGDITLARTIKDTYILLAEPGYATRQWSSVDRCREEAEHMTKVLGSGTPIAIISIENDGCDYTLERL